jgi:hypothetical protein
MEVEFLLGGRDQVALKMGEVVRGLELDFPMMGVRRRIWMDGCIYVHDAARQIIGR